MDLTATVWPLETTPGLSDTRSDVIRRQVTSNKTVAVHRRDILDDQSRETRTSMAYDWDGFTCQSICSSLCAFYFYSVLLQRRCRYRWSSRRQSYTSRRLSEIVCRKLQKRQHKLKDASDYAAIWRSWVSWQSTSRRSMKSKSPLLGNSLYVSIYTS